MDNIFYCYVDIMNVRMKAFFDRKQFDAIRQNPKGGAMTMYFKELPEVVKEAAVVFPIDPIEVPDMGDGELDIPKAKVKKGKRK